MYFLFLSILAKLPSFLLYQISTCFTTEIQNNLPLSQNNSRYRFCLCRVCAAYPLRQSRIFPKLAYWRYCGSVPMRQRPPSASFQKQFLISPVPLSRHSLFTKLGRYRIFQLIIARIAVHIPQTDHAGYLTALGIHDRLGDRCAFCRHRIESSASLMLS